VAVGFVHQAGAALFFEEVDGVGEGVALEEQALDLEGVGFDGAAAGGASQVVAAFSGEGVEVEGPEVPVAPFLNRAGVLRGDVEDLLVRDGIVERARGELV
jgi:hypothetical protein